MLCIRKRETVSHLQYVYVLDFVYQKEGKYFIPTVWAWSRLCISERHCFYGFVFIQYKHVLTLCQEICHFTINRGFFTNKTHHPNDKVHILYNFLHFYNSYRNTIAFSFPLLKCSDHAGMIQIPTFRHNLDTKHTVGIIQFSYFWYTKSRS
jgi:hypothetical protein